MAVYTPAQQQKRAEIFQRTAEIEAQLQHRNPDWQKRMAAWEERVRTDQPEWKVLSLTVDDISTGGERELRLQGRLHAGAGIRARPSTPWSSPPRRTCRASPRCVWNCSPIRIFPTAVRAVRSRARGALTEFLVDAASADDSRQVHKAQNRQSDGRHQSAGDAAGTEFRRQERQAARHRSDRIRHRRQGRDRLGNRCRSRTAQPAAQSRLPVRTAGDQRQRHDSAICA